MHRLSRSLPAMIGATLVLALISAFARDLCLADPGLAVAGCASDLRVMWFERGLAEHHVPFLQPILDPVTGQLLTVEYPVLSGMLMWLVSLPVDSVRGFVALHAAVMAVCAVGITIILHRTCGARAWLWAASPVILWHLAFNNDAFAALFTVAALALLGDRDPVAVGVGRCVAAAALLGLGGAAKLYPLLFVLPLALWLLFGSPGPTREPVAVRVRRAGLVVATAVGVVVAVNLPFALANPEGWLAPFRFQAARSIGPDTLSVWYLLGQVVPVLQPALNGLATAATALGLVAVALVTCWRARRTGRFDLLNASVAFLVTYLVLNKVFSPQYALWLLPLLVLAGFPARQVWTYVAIDAVLFLALQVTNTSAFQGWPQLAAAGVGVVLVAALARLVWVVVLGRRALVAGVPSG